MTNDLEHRVKCVAINPRLLIDVLNMLRDPKAPRAIALQSRKDIPEDAVVVDVHHDYRRRSLVAVLRHPSFPPIITAGEIPFADDFAAEYAVVRDTRWRFDDLNRQTLTADNAREMLDDMQQIVDAGKRFAIRWGTTGEESREMMNEADQRRLDDILEQMQDVEELAAE